MVTGCSFPECGVTRTIGNLDAVLPENHPCRVTFSSFSETRKYSAMHWTHLASNPWVMASVGLFCLFVVLAAIAWIRKRLWMFRATGIIALVGLLAGFLLSHDKTQYAPPSPAKAAVQEIKATAHLQPTSQVTTSTFHDKQEQPFPEPVKPHALNSLAPRLWVVSSSGEVTEYDASTFEAKETVKIPPDAIPSDESYLRYSIEINRRGQILVGPTFHGPDAASTRCTLWLWNGQSGSNLNCGNEHREDTAADGERILTEILSRPGLAADGEHLFWFVNQQKQKEGDEEKDIMPSVTTTFHISETSLSGDQRKEIDSFSFPDCTCSTGACEESCPTAEAWVPKTGIENFFVAFGSYTGQVTQTTYVRESLYRKSPDGQWSSSSLPSSFDDILDAAEDASAFIVLIPDSACCGWNNESNDRTLLLRKGQTIVLFDEFARYNNSQYDVNYSATEAQLSPDNQLVAMTISSSARQGEEFRSSDESNLDKLSAEVVEHINKTLADLPAVEVVTATDPPKRAAYLPNTSFVGWLSQREILILKDSVLVAYDVVTGTTRKSNVSVGDKAYAFVR
jgi:hypothetical protein